MEGFGSRFHSDSLDWDDGLGGGDEKWFKLRNILKMQRFGVTDTLDMEWERKVTNPHFVPAQGGQWCAMYQRRKWWGCGEQQTFLLGYIILKVFFRYASGNNV